MKYLFPFVLFFTLILSSCENKDIVLQSSPHIKKFSFGTHSQVPGIENVQFTIDSIQCLIYNTDSVAYDMNLTKLFPFIEFTGSPKEIKVNGKDWNQKDSIDFSQPVTLYVQSQNKKGEATYTITLNKHKHNPEEILWEMLPSISHPSTIQESKAAVLQDQLYIIVKNQDGNTTYYSKDAHNWQSIDSKEDINVASIATYKGHIYAISTDATKLCRFEEDQWIPVADGTHSMTMLLGELNQKLWIAGKDATNNTLSFFDGTTIQTVEDAILPQLFNLAGSTPLTTSTALYLLGGDNNNQAQNSVLSTDNGFYWTNILNQSGQYAFTPRHHASAVYYDNYLYIFGGLSTNQTVEQTSYRSKDNGYSWTPIPTYQQLPSSYQWKKGCTAVSFQDNIFLVGTSSSQQEITLCKGRIHKADFIQQ